MAELKNIPFFLSEKEGKMFGGGHRSKSSVIVDHLKRLPADSSRCFEVRRETDDDDELERKRALWIAVARRSGFRIITRITDNEVSDKVLRIWRRS